MLRRRRAGLEITDFEKEHSYSKHVSLLPKDLPPHRKHRVDLVLSDDEPMSDDEIDIMTAPKQPDIKYNRAKIETQFKETEKLILSRVFGLYDVEDPIEPEKKFWDEYSPIHERVKQQKVSKKVIVLDDTVQLILKLHLSCISVVDCHLEAMKRRTAIDKAAQIFRLRFAELGHDSPTLPWLHMKIVDLLPPNLLALYIDVLSSLRSKIPELLKISLEPIIQQGTTKAAIALGLTTRKPWDPLNASHLNLLNQKLVANTTNAPLIIRLPSRPTPTSNLTPQMRRFRLWNTQLSAFGHVQHAPNQQNCHTLSEYVENMVHNVRQMIKKHNKRHPNQPVILVGWENAALVSLYVALCEEIEIAAICCLGLPLKSPHGWRYNNQDPIMDVKCPIFVASGSKPDNSDVIEVEDYLEQIEAHTSLVVVHDGDSLLRITSAKQHRHGLTQAMVDKLVIDEMWEFLNNLMTERAKKDPSSVSMNLQNSDKEKAAKRSATKTDTTELVTEYKNFLKKKAQSLGGRMPTVEENRQYFAEFQELRNREKALSKKKKMDEDDQDWRMPGERKKTERKKSGSLIALPIKMHKTPVKPDLESSSAASQLEKLLDFD